MRNARERARLRSERFNTLKKISFLKLKNCSVTFSYKDFRLWVNFEGNVVCSEPARLDPERLFYYYSFEEFFEKLDPQHKKEMSFHLDLKNYWLGD